MAYRIAICDDSREDAGCSLLLAKEWAAARSEEVACEIFPSAESFLFRFEEDKSFDILLLDIEMGRMDGVELAGLVRRESEVIQIVFITGYSDYIEQGYDVSALHYLMKPVSKEKFFGVMDRARQRLAQSQRCISFEAGGVTEVLPTYTVRYLEVYGNYVTLHARRDYTVKRTLADFEKELGAGFYRVGRSYILNLKQIRRITKKEVILSDGTALPLPRGAYEPLCRAVIAGN